MRMTSRAATSSQYQFHGVFAAISLDFCRLGHIIKVSNETP